MVEQLADAAMSRRVMVLGMAGLGLGFLPACADSKERRADRAQSRATPASVPMIVYRDPGCGCCTKWAQIAQDAGFRPVVKDHPQMAELKKQKGVPDELVSCHTTLVGGYVVEGHVPLDAVKRLLAKRPPIRGIAVPGMPQGSPGMEVPGVAAQPFQVLAFDAQGKVSRFDA